MLIGNVGKDPELKHTPSGIPVTSFRMATSKTWRDRDGKKKEHTDWHTIVAWRKLAEVITKIVSKGARVYVEGRLQTRNFEHEGEKKQVVEILADNILLLESKSERDGHEGAENYSYDENYSDDNFDNNDSEDSFDNYDKDYGDAVNTDDSSKKEYSF